MAPSTSEDATPAKKQKLEAESTGNEDLARRVAILKQGQDSVESLKDKMRG